VIQIQFLKQTKTNAHKKTEEFRDERWMHAYLGTFHIVPICYVGQRTNLQTQYQTVFIERHLINIHLPDKLPVDRARSTE
jgi:hypothetical protein